MFISITSFQIYYRCHCYRTSISDHLLFCLQLTWHWYQPDTPELVYSTSGCGWYCNYLIGCQWFSKLKWSASTAQLPRRMLTNDGSSIFGAKDFQQRSTTLWIFKFAPLLIPIILTQIYYINYYFNFSHFIPQRQLQQNANQTNFKSVEMIRVSR